MLNKCINGLLLAAIALILSTGCSDNPTVSVPDTDAAVSGPDTDSAVSVTDTDSLESAIDAGALESVIDTDALPANLHLVTDVILTAGQSNALADGTRFEPEVHPEDRLDPRILVWTQHNGWKVANPLTQIWEYDRFPARLWDPVNSNNSPGFQIARAIVDADPSRVVAFIPTSTPGQSIRYWRFGETPYNAINQRVVNALNELPSKFDVDLIWWMQGESDANASDFYRRELAALIDGWRTEPWYGSDNYFIANETVGYEVNQIFRELRTDADQYTDYSEAEDLSTIQPGGDHYDSQAYRIIGNRVQQIYFDMRNAAGE